jgi:hypothetical protein
VAAAMCVGTGANGSRWTGEMEAMWFRGVWVGPFSWRVEAAVLPVIGYGLAHFVLQNSFSSAYRSEGFDRTVFFPFQFCFHIFLEQTDVVKFN